MKKRIEQLEAAIEGDNTLASEEVQKLLLLCTLDLMRCARLWGYSIFLVATVCFPFMAWASFLLLHQRAMLGH